MHCDHPFILRLVRTFKDADYIYFLTDFVAGTDLWQVIRDLGWVNEAACRFYIGSLLLAVEHLHEREIIHRDVKPENVLVGKDGYLKLADFGSAKRLVGGRTVTVIGTPHYMAPEVIAGHSYGLSADLWSLGVVLYELLYSKLPFGDTLTNPMDVYKAVSTGKLVFPDHRHADANHLIGLLLNSNSVSRTTAKKVKRHIWFTGFDWGKLAGRAMTAPYKPQPFSPDDAPPTQLQTLLAEHALPMSKQCSKNKLTCNSKREPAGWDHYF
jgi:cGMP-dependent protein kinase